MSSPTRSTVSAASGGAVSATEDIADSIDALYRKDEVMAELKSEVMEVLLREVRSLDDDSWMFATPRSRINLVSSPASILGIPQSKGSGDGARTPVEILKVRGDCEEVVASGTLAAP